MATWTMDVRVSRDETRGDIDLAKAKASKLAAHYLGVERDPDDWKIVTEPDGWEFTWSGEG